MSHIGKAAYNGLSRLATNVGQNLPATASNVINVIILANMASRAYGELSPRGKSQPSPTTPPSPLSKPQPSPTQLVSTQEANMQPQFLPKGVKRS